VAGLRAGFPRVTLALLLLLAAPPPAALGGDGSSSPPPPGSCAERYPEDGPAGVDLRLGCIVSEVVGLYTAGQSEAPPTLSTYAIGTIGVVALLAVLGLVVTRLLARRAGERLAPVTPGEWWLCPSCRSVNGTQASRCYRCGSPPGAGPTLTTEDAPATPQSWGRGKHG
jgi:hypothetical protein